MTRTFVTSLWLSAVLALAPIDGHAHHSAIMYDDTKVIELEGSVKEFQYANPHAWLIVNVTNKDGTETTWGFEAGSGPTVLLRSGIHKGDFPVGTKVKIKGHPMRDGRNAARWLEVTRLSDGKVFNPNSGF